MEPTKPKLPGEAIQLYNLFIHGEIGRREFLAGVQRFAVGGLTAAAIVEALMPNYAKGSRSREPTIGSMPATKPSRRRKETGS